MPTRGGWAGGEPPKNFFNKILTEVKWVLEINTAVCCKVSLDLRRVSNRGNKGQIWLQFSRGKPYKSRQGNDVKKKSL